MTNSNKINEEAELGYVLRLLNTPLQGCEFALPEGTTLFVLDSLSNQKSSELLLPDNVIHIPMDNADVNFEVCINLKENEPVKILEVRDLSSQQIPTTINDIVEIGGVRFSIKKYTDEWNAKIFNDVKLSKHSITKTAYASFICVAVIAMLLTIFIKSYSNSDSNTNNRLLTSLGGNERYYTINKGEDDVRYVIAPTEHLANWARQSFSRFKLDDKLVVLNQSQEADRIASWLDINWNSVKYHSISFKDPLYPTIYVSQERNDIQNKQHGLVTNLKANIPYAKDIFIKEISDSVIEYEAEQGLAKLSIPYHKEKNKESVSFILQGELSDSQILKIKKFINSHHKVWGGDYIKFAVELKDKNSKSLRFGSDGYIKESSDHWYFF